jgi:hypothetical protein
MSWYMYLRLSGTGQKLRKVKESPCSYALDLEYMGVQARLGRRRLLGKALGSLRPLALDRVQVLTAPLLLATDMSCTAASPFLGLAFLGQFLS